MNQDSRQGALAHEAGGCMGLVPLFAGLGPSELGDLASITVERRFEKGETIYFAGKSDKRLYIIHAGRVKLSRLGPSGRAQIIRLVGQGQFFGELTILNEAPLSDYAEALEAGQACMIEGGRLKELMRRNPSIAFKVMEELSARLDRAEGRIAELRLQPIEARLARSLLELAGGDLEFELPVSKGDYASQLGVTQETLSRKLSSFQERGLIALRGQRGIRILDGRGLAALDAGNSLEI